MKLNCKEIINGLVCSGQFKIGIVLINPIVHCFSNSGLKFVPCLKCDKCGYSEVKPSLLKSGKYD